MKDRKKIIIIISIIFIITLVTIILIIINIRIKNKECIPFSGGSYNLIFETNSKDEIPNISVCIACPPDSYDEIPTPKNEGYEFNGWYYDKNLKNKVNVNKTNEITPVIKRDKNNCMNGYENVKLYAKWKKV